MEGSIIGEDLKLNIRGLQQDLSHVEMSIKNLSEREKIIRVSSMDSTIHNTYFQKVTGEVRIFPQELRFISSLKALIGAGRFNLNSNIDLIKNRLDINFVGKKIKVEDIKREGMYGAANFSGKFYGNLVAPSSPEGPKEMIKILRRIKLKHLASSLFGNVNLRVQNGSIEHLRPPKDDTTLKRRQILISNLLKQSDPKLVKFNKRGGLSFDSLNANSTISNGLLTINSLSLVNPYLSISGQGQINIADKILSVELDFLKTKDREKSYGFKLEGSFPFGDKLQTLQLTPNIN